MVGVQRLVEHRSVAASVSIRDCTRHSPMNQASSRMCGSEGVRMTPLADSVGLVCAEAIVLVPPSAVN